MHRSCASLLGTESPVRVRNFFRVRLVPGKEALGCWPALCHPLLATRPPAALVPPCGTLLVAGTARQQPRRDANAWERQEKPCATVARPRKLPRFQQQLQQCLPLQLSSKIKNKIKKKKSADEVYHFPAMLLLHSRLHRLYTLVLIAAQMTARLMEAPSPAAALLPAGCASGSLRTIPTTCRVPMAIFSLTSL